MINCFFRLFFFFKRYYTEVSELIQNTYVWAMINDLIRFFFKIYQTEVSALIQYSLNFFRFLFFNRYYSEVSELISRTNLFESWSLIFSDSSSKDFILKFQNWFWILFESFHQILFQKISCWSFRIDSEYSLNFFRFFFFKRYYTEVSELILSTNLFESWSMISSDKWKWGSLVTWHNSETSPCLNWNIVPGWMSL